MEKPVYKIVDGFGRIYLPAESRKAAGIGRGDIVRLEVRRGQISARRVELIEVGDHSPEALAAYITAGVPYLTDEQLRDVIGQILDRLKQKDTEGTV